MQLLAAASAAALAGATPALAQEAAAGPDAPGASQLEEVVVTARRVEENQQRVPIALTALTNADIERKDIRLSTQLNLYVPGLTVCCYRGAGNSTAGQSALIYLRGVPGVVSYFADVPTEIGGQAYYYDLQNVQVLKGPQGTLFGLSANAGAIVLQPRRPTEEPGGYLQATLGEYSRKGLEGAINAPLLDGKLLIRVGFQVEERDGYIRDLTQNRNLADENFWVARVSAILRPNDRFENYLMVNYAKDHSFGDPFVLHAVNPNGNALRRFPILSQYLAQQQALGWYTILGSGVPNGTRTRNTTLNLSNVTTVKLTDDIHLKNIFGFVRSKGLRRFDAAGVPVPIFRSSELTVSDSSYNPQYTDELQIQGTALDGKLSFTVGSFNRWKHGKLSAPILNLTLGTLAGTQPETWNRTHALYAQGTYDFSDFVQGLSVTAGYRYTWDHVRQRSIAYNASAQPVPATAADLEADFRAPGYTLSLAYQATPGTLFYVTNSKGYSTGGFNAATIPEPFRTFGPESLNNIEAGVKSDFHLGGMQARANLSIFYGWYDDVKVTVTQAVPNGSGGTTFTTLTENAAKAHIQGIEAEATLIPFEGLRLSGNFTYVKDRYDRYMSLTSTGAAVDLSGTPFILIPKWKYSLSASYTLPLPEDVGAVSLTADFSSQDDAFSTQPVPPVENLYHGLDNLNLTLSWDDIMGREGVYGAVFATNLTKNHWATGKLGAYTSLGVTASAVAEPRMWGVRMGYRF